MQRYVLQNYLPFISKKYVWRYRNICTDSPVMTYKYLPLSLNDLSHCRNSGLRFSMYFSGWALISGKYPPISAANWVRTYMSFSPSWKTRQQSVQQSVTAATAIGYFWYLHVRPEKIFFHGLPIVVDLVQNVHDSHAKIMYTFSLQLFRFEAFFIVLCGFVLTTPKVLQCRSSPWSCEAENRRFSWVRTRSSVGCSRCQCAFSDTDHTLSQSQSQSVFLCRALLLIWYRRDPVEADSRGRCLVSGLQPITSRENVKLLAAIMRRRM